MKETDLRQFTRQLAIWAELVIEHGRTPFRRVDQFPLLHTRRGTFRPPLVFWINRQSLMAGGIILLPDNDLPLQLELGSATAEALGLKHFVTWENSRICIWKTEGAGPSEEKQIPVCAGDDPEAFRALLLEVMEEIKLLSVLGMVPPNQLSSIYLHNLFQQTIDSAHTPMVNRFRQTRADGQLIETINRADRQAEQANHLTLLRLLALLWHNLLPETIMPEKLDAAMQLVLPSLPPELHLALVQERQEPTLPLESAVCYHHLLLRLRQINWNKPEERARQAICSFLTKEKAPLKPPFLTASESGSLLQINPQTPRLNHTQLHELSNSISYLATAALLRHINDLPPANQHRGTLFTFSELPAPLTRIQGRITNRRKVPREFRQRCDTLLRTSWPTRRFNLPAETPYWVLETIHILGLCPQGAELELEIPAAWLVVSFGQVICELIADDFQLQAITWEEETTILLLQKRKETAQFTIVRNHTTERQLDWSEATRNPRALLLQSLLLPDEIFPLFIEGFQPCSDLSVTTSCNQGLVAYSRTTLGQRLWTLLGGATPPHSAEEIRHQADQIGWLIPSEHILCRLSLPNPEAKMCEDQTAELNQCLAELLGLPDPIEIPLPQWQEKHAVAAGRQVATPNHRLKILHALEARGLPDFPEQYLYQLDSPQLSSYRFKPPLQVTSELLGQFELTDASRKSFSVQGEATAEALKLCAAQGRSEVELPVDQQQLGNILTSYRNDLLQLRQELARQAHILLESPQAAERLSKRIWLELKLPSWKWLDH